MVRFGAFEGGGPEPPFPVWFERPMRGVVQSHLPCSVRGAFERGGPEPLFRFEGPLRGGGSRTRIPYTTA